MALALLSVAAKAQELNCKITVNSSKVQTGNNAQVFNTLQSALQDFMNNHKWTEMTFLPNERIDCNMLIMIKTYADNNVMAEITVQASRPVYGSTYTTPLFNFKDGQFNFSYRQYDPIELNTSTYDDNLTAVLAYYAYVIIGLDMDSFSENGGAPYFQQANQIVTMMQSKSNDSELSGWKAFDSDKNRYALIDNLTDSRFGDFHEFMYQYHRLALDNMINNADNARALIANNIHVLRDINRKVPSAVLIQEFVSSKSDELVNIFSQGTSDERTKVYEILTDVDPSNTNKYDKIKSSK